MVFHILHHVMFETIFCEQSPASCCAVWLLAFSSGHEASAHSRADASPPCITTQLLYLKCRPSDLCSSERKNPQVGQIVLVNGMRVESIQSVDSNSSAFSIPDAILRCHDGSHKFVVASFCNIGDNSYNNTKDQGGFINVSAMVALVTSAGLFRPLGQLEEFASVLMRDDHNNVHSSLLVLECTFVSSKRIGHLQSVSVVSADGESFCDVTYVRADAFSHNITILLIFV